MTKDKNILLGITGSIAAYKAPYLIRGLCKHGYEVKVVLSQAAKSFVTVMTLQALSNNSVYEELLSPENEAAMSHIDLARWADVILVSPATAHFMAKLAHGFADDLLSTLSLIANVPIILAPAMNQQMWLAQATQENLKILKQRGFLCWGPSEGSQACGEEGPGRMMEPDEIIHQLELFTADKKKKLLLGKNILITAGPTQEAIDPVRYLSNRSSGKMGFALAQAAIAEGAKVTLVSGPVAISPPVGCTYIQVKTAKEMLAAVEDCFENQDIFISAAAVADYYVKTPATQKIKKHEEVINITLNKTSDILATVCKKKKGHFVVGFAAETENVLANAKAKYDKKGMDLMVLNDVSDLSIGFESDDNAATIFSSKQVVSLAKAPKTMIAKKIMGIISENLK